METGRSWRLLLLGSVAVSEKFRDLVVDEYVQSAWDFVYSVCVGGEGMDGRVGVVTSRYDNCKWEASGKCA